MFTETAPIVTNHDILDTTIIALSVIVVVLIVIIRMLFIFMKRNENKNEDENEDKNEDKNIHIEDPEDTFSKFENIDKESSSTESFRDEQLPNGKINADIVRLSIKNINPDRVRGSSSVNLEPKQLDPNVAIEKAEKPKTTEVPGEAVTAASNADDKVVEPEAIKVPEEAVTAASNADDKVVEPEAIKVPEEAVTAASDADDEVVKPEAIEAPEETVTAASNADDEVMKPEAIEVPEEAVTAASDADDEVVEPESIEVPEETVTAASDADDEVMEPEAIEEPEETITAADDEVVEPEAIEEPEENVAHAVNTVDLYDEMSKRCLDLDDKTNSDMLLEYDISGELPEGAKVLHPYACLYAYFFLTDLLRIYSELELARGLLFKGNSELGIDFIETVFKNDEYGLVLYNTKSNEATTLAISTSTVKTEDEDQLCHIEPSTGTANYYGVDGVDLSWSAQ